MTDGFGRRITSTDPGTADPVELLELAPALAAHAGFVTALADRVKRLAEIRHASYVHVRRLDRPAPNQLVIVSDRTIGPRVSDLLEHAQRAKTRPDIEAVVALMRQLLPAVALFARHNRTQAIGTIAPERLFAVPQGRVVVADSMLGPAVDALALDRVEAWRRYGIVSPPGEGAVLCTPRVDAMAMAVVALSLLQGRVLADDAFPDGLSALIGTARERHGADERPLSPVLATWLRRALQLDESASFDSPHAAQVGFEDVLASDPRYVTRTEALETWVRHYEDAKHASPRQGGAHKRHTARAGASETPAQDAAEDDAAPAAPRPMLQLLPKIAAALFVLVLIETVLIVWLWSRPVPVFGEGDGELVIQSRPEAARVIINGTDRGETPLTLTLPAGTHVMEVRSGAAEPRIIPLTIRPGAQTAQYVELQEPASPARRAAPAGRPRPR